TAMQRTIDNAAREIDWDLDYDPADNPSPSPGTADYAVLTEVNLARAVELWNIEFRPFGQLPAGPDAFPILAARDSWYRHHLRLHPRRTRYPVGRRDDVAARADRSCSGPARAAARPAGRHDPGHITD